MICYHHNDADGRAAAWMAYTHTNSFAESFPSSYIECDYNTKFDKHTQKDDVLLLDLAISPSTYGDLLKLCETARSVTWIDHHKTSTDIVNSHLDELQSIQNLTYFVSEGTCGAALTYAYFEFPHEELCDIRDTDVSSRQSYQISATTENNIIKMSAYKFNPGKKLIRYFQHDIEMPKFLFHVDDFDCWKRNDIKSNYYILGIGTEDTAIHSYDSNINAETFNHFWMDNLYMNVDEYVSKGDIITKYNDYRFKEELPSTFEWEYNGTKFLCSNNTGNSKNFMDTIDDYEAVILFNYSGKSSKWEYSVYASDSSHFDCKAFCEQFGGGGHTKASGFSTEKLIFLHSMKEKEKKQDIIFLGGTCGEYNWRSEFISIWKDLQKDSKRTKDTKLYNPIVEDWKPDDVKRENEVKENAKLNLFLITSEQKGPYSYADAVECSHYGKVFFAIYDKYDQGAEWMMKSMNAIGEIIKKHRGVYKTYDHNSTMEDIVRDVIRNY